MVEPLPEEVGRLADVAFKDFVKARDALATELRSTGRPGEAAAVSKLRKPTPAVWVINRVARADPAAVARFVETVDRLKRAHFGEPALLAQATEAHRAALDHLLERAKAMLADAGVQSSAGVIGRISATLLGAAADPETRRDLRQGRLTRERQAPGFEALAGTAGTGQVLREDRTPTAEKQRARAVSRDRKGAVQKARAAFRAAESDARDARRRAEQSEREATQRRQAADQAAREAEGLKQRVRDSEQRARVERRAAEHAAAAAVRARREAAQLEARVHEVQRALDTATKRRRTARRCS